MPSDATFKIANTLHRGVLKLTGGKLGWRGSGMPVVQLTTIGRKSGKPHTVMLTSPVQDGETIVVVASKGGDDDNPAWIHNLRDNPEVTVALAGKAAQPMTARIATAEERAALWPRVTATSPGYANYQTKTTREIPLVLLTPR